jgi:hypothetical protein
MTETTDDEHSAAIPQTVPNGDVVTGDIVYDGRVILYIIKG